MPDRVQTAMHFWWLIFPLGGMIGGAVRIITVSNERRVAGEIEA